MSNRYTTIDGEIILTLPPNDIFEILKELNGDEDLLLPHIKITDNKVIFRDQDLKLLIPEEFFHSQIPKYKPSDKLRRNFIIMLLINFALSLFLFFNKNLEVALGSFIWFGLFLVMFGWSCYKDAETEYVERQRKVLYTKAKLTTFLQLTLMQDIVSQSGRYERTNNRLEQEITATKELVRFAYNHVPSTVKSLHLPNTFPDGEDIDKGTPPKYN